MKKPVPIIWKYMPWHILLIILALSLLTGFAYITLKQTYINKTTESLKSKSTIIGFMIKPALQKGNLEQIQTACDSLGKILPGRITVILANGRVVGDSDENPLLMENHAARPEVLEALKTGLGISTRFSSTLKISMHYVAVSVKTNDVNIAVIRSSLPLTTLSSTLNRLLGRIGIALIIIIILATLITLAISNTIKKPLTALIEGANNFSRGNFDKKIYISDPLEFNQLGKAMNNMAEELKGRIETMDAGQQEMENILSGMSEALIVLDMQEKIIRFNQAASNYFNIDSAHSVGRPLPEVVRNMDILRFVEKIRLNKDTEDQEIVIRVENKKYFLTSGRIIEFKDQKDSWILLVFNDITRMQKLETIRKEFVANVSHELKTPITAISASVETLIEGAINDTKMAGRFLQIIRSHSARLLSLVEDLLQISRLEETGQTLKADLVYLSLAPVLEKAAALCTADADRKQSRINLDCSQDVKADILPAVLEQAVVNLIDNAVKYSPSGSIINIRCLQKEAEICIEVSDNGPGIEGDHINRIFERFYRVDKSRSREQGGTGLGLAIVKHAVLTLGGNVGVESSPAKGSCFTIKLPVSQHPSPTRTDR